MESKKLSFNYFGTFSFSGKIVWYFQGRKVAPFVIFKLHKNGDESAKSGYDLLEKNLKIAVLIT